MKLLATMCAASAIAIAQIASAQQPDSTVETESVITSPKASKVALDAPFDVTNDDLCWESSEWRGQPESPRLTKLKAE